MVSAGLRFRDLTVMSADVWSVLHLVLMFLDGREWIDVGRKPSDNYDYGEPGKWGEGVAGRLHMVAGECDQPRFGAAQTCRLSLE